LYDKYGTELVESKLLVAETRGFKAAKRHLPSLLLKLDHSEVRRKEKGSKGRESNG